MFPSFRSAGQIVRLWLPARKQRTIRRQDNRVPLVVEKLEDRSLPSVNWINPAGGDWNTAANWFDSTTMTNHVPGVTDDVVISTPGITISHSSTSFVKGLSLSGATLNDSGTLTVTGLFAWTGGVLAGTGSLTSNGAASFGGVTLDGYTLNNAGYATMIGGVYTFDGAVFNNETTGTMDIQFDGFCLGSTVFVGQIGAVSTFNNAGLVKKTAGTNPNLGAQIQLLNIHSSGIVDDESGGLSLGYYNYSSDYSGQIIGAHGTTLQFPGGPTSFSTASSIVADNVVFYFTNAATIAGKYVVHGSTSATGSYLTFLGPVDVANSNLFIHENFGGSFDFTGATLLAPMNLNDVHLGGTLASNGDMHIATFFARNATLSGSGTVYLDGGTQANPNLCINGYYILNRNLINRGYTIGGAFVSAGQTLTNAAGATIELQDNEALVGSGTFNNLGTVRKTSTGYPFNVDSMDALFHNFSSGVVDIESGRMILHDGTNEGNIFSADGTIVDIAGTFTFAPRSTFNADELRVYDSANGFRPWGVLDEQLGGQSPGAGYDQLHVRSDVELAGQLQLDLVNGFTPNLNDPFTIIDNQSTNPIAGTFANLAEGAVLAVGGNQFKISYVGGDGNDVVLTAIVVANSPPIASAGGPYTMTYGGSLTLDASASSDPDHDALSYSWTVNGQANAAAGVSPTLTWSQLQILGVTSAQPFSVSVQVDDGHGHHVSTSTVVTVNKAASVFSNLTAATGVLEATTTVLSGKISAGLLIPTGTVSITLNNITVPATINPDGTFSASINTKALGVGQYGIAYSYAGSANFTAASGVGSLQVTYGIRAVSDFDDPKKAGSTISFEIELTNANGADVSAKSIVVTAVGIAPTSNPSAILPAQSAGKPNPGNLFIFEHEGDGDRDHDDRNDGAYEFDLKTPKGLAAGTYLFFFTIQGDPITHSVQFRVRG